MPTIETDLKDVLAKIDARLDRIEQKLEALPRLETEVANIKEDVRELKGSQRAQIWALIGIIFSVMISAIVKFGFFPNP
ncbi:hemolysin XhlA family protein [Synechocystis sp. PCC 7339]|uniref:hemolysin XhlA family protein n=1 Tax=Synechocystis sp. PCC 7339 TaxID=2782213 RepID=UPI001CBB13E5|nr:hemolysin XhlA family protein [Synechocystis sp. PCC 7339]UAJ73753.1 hemolysin XhlA family protein [Synechocystis sp. PCC 7339]